MKNFLVKGSLFLVFFIFATFEVSYSSMASETKVFDSGTPISYQDGCHLPHLEFQPKNCFYGDLTSNFTVYLIGDSHAAQWLPG